MPKASRKTQVDRALSAWQGKIGQVLMRIYKYSFPFLHIFFHFHVPSYCFFNHNFHLLDWPHLRAKDIAQYPHIYQVIHLVGFTNLLELITAVFLPLGLYVP